MASPVIFDEKLNWKEHGDKTAAKINQKKNNILKSLAGSEWGTSTQSLLRYVNGCLRPIAEYGLQALTRSRTDPFENQAIKEIDAAMRRALKIALGVPQRTKNELVHVLSDTMPISCRAKQAALIYHDKILHFGPEHPLYESVKKVGNYPLMKPKKKNKYKNKNKPNRIVNKRRSWAAVMIDMRKKLHLELPEYDNPVIYLPQIDYLVNATFHIHALSDTKENLIKDGKLKLEGKRIQDTFVTPELLNSNADSYFTDGSVCQESNQAGAAALLINNLVCALVPFGIQTKITNKTSSMAAELKGIETALEHSLTSPIAREKINIFTDSLSALQALQKIPPVDNVQIINPKLGIKGNMLAYIVDYLNDRKGTVKFQGSKSQVKDFDLGTPQGSCISPFLFNIIMNRLISKDPDDICSLRYPDGVKIVSNADDSNHE